MEQMGNLDWRFAIVQKMCGISYNKVSVRGGSSNDIENANIRQALIEKRDQTVITFVVSLFENLTLHMDILNYFSSSLEKE